jgi:putative acetyltransferase
MGHSIVPVTEAHFVQLREVLDSVAREKRFLAFTEAPPLEQSLAFYRDIVDNDHCQFVALDGARVVGWCDILPTHGQARAHVGCLGIGLLREARGQGIGARLMEVTIAKARTKGLTRIELTVRVDNLSAKALYECFGFVVEGLLRRAMRVDDQYYDMHAMALLLG